MKREWYDSVWQAALYTLYEISENSYNFMLFGNYEDVFEHKIFLHEKVVYQKNVFDMIHILRITLGSHQNWVFDFQYLWVYWSISQVLRSFNIWTLLHVIMLSTRILWRKILLSKETKIAKLRLRFFEFFKISVRGAAGVFLYLFNLNKELVGRWIMLRIKRRRSFLKRG